MSNGAMYMKIVVIGKSGQLATELSYLASDEINIICLGRNEIDIATYFKKSLCENL